MSVVNNMNWRLCSKQQMCTDTHLSLVPEARKYRSAVLITSHMNMTPEVKKVYFESRESSTSSRGTASLAVLQTALSRATSLVREVGEC